MQTDMMDLLGSDLPTEGERADFSWSDGVFLQVSYIFAGNLFFGLIGHFGLLKDDHILSF